MTTGGSVTTTDNPACSQQTMQSSTNRQAIYLSIYIVHYQYHSNRKLHGQAWPSVAKRVNRIPQRRNTCVVISEMKKIVEFDRSVDCVISTFYYKNSGETCRCGMAQRGGGIVLVGTQVVIYQVHSNSGKQQQQLKKKSDGLGWVSGLYYKDKDRKVNENHSSNFLVCLVYAGSTVGRLDRMSDMRLYVYTRSHYIICG